MPAALPLPDPEPNAARWRILVRGTVQGVGFRPFVYRTAVALGLSGWVRNVLAGVEIEAEGPASSLDALVARIAGAPPPHAAITAVERQAMPVCGATGFAVRESAATGRTAGGLLPDLATCDACLAELFDLADRRHRYPFICCTACGPRFSIVEGLPYDRARTTMRHFAMCPACLAEYRDPASRRFHAEPNACPVCGPRLRLLDPAGAVQAAEDDALRAAAAAIAAGGVVAVKGIGGFHLLADAADDTAVARLRAGKARGDKPFAVMVPDLDAARALGPLEPGEAALLASTARPIVLVRRGGAPVAAAVAPGSARLGLLLPYSPLHHLLLRALGRPLVATSGNRGGEPIATGTAAALDRLSGLADLLLVHDRPIRRPLDDSVMQMMAGRSQVLRRGRGLAPGPVLPDGAALPDGLLACGGHLKAAIAVTGGGGLLAGPHLGDLDGAAARDGHARAMADLPALAGTVPRLAACDLHPDYAATRAAEDSGLPVVAVQHHVAHIAACMAEHGLTPPLLGIAWDGAGWGPDGTLWGGEAIRITAAGWQRVAHLRRFPLPGGAAAAREPRRAALGLLWEAQGEAGLDVAAALPPLAAFAEDELRLLRTALARGVNAPRTSSAGRLFDAFASLCGLVQKASYEGQAAAALEWAADGIAVGQAYDLPLRDGADGMLQIDWRPALLQALDALRAGAGPATISAALHAGLAAAIAAVAQRAGADRVVLTGGCFQNRRLGEAAAAALAAAGIATFQHRLVPPNDGGLAVGQAVWAGWLERGEVRPCA